MRSTIALMLSTIALVAACSRETPAAVTAAAVALPADVRDLARPQAPPAEPKAAPAAEATAPMAARAVISANGELTSPMRSEVAPKQPGRVAAVYVREGARVRAGQPLAAFELDYLTLDLQRAEADLARARAIESDAARELARKRELVASESVSRAAFDRVQSQYESVSAARQAADAVVATIRQRIADATLRAPFDGVVESKSIDVGEHVGEGEAAFVIVQTSPLKLRFRLPEQYLDKLREGQLLNATTDAYDTPFAGRITMIGGVIDPTTRTLVAEADVPNDSGLLRPGMFARLTVGQ